MAGAAKLLCTMLDCGECDLEMLDRVGYDWEDVLGHPFRITTKAVRNLPWI